MSIRQVGLDAKALALLPLGGGALLLTFYLPLFSLSGATTTGPSPVDAALAYLSEPLFWHAFGVTLRVSFATTLLCILLATPVALFIAHLSGSLERALVAIVMSSLFSSILLRTFAWFVLLGRNGPVASVLGALSTDGAAPALLFTQFSVILGMTHILLPTAILVIWSGARTLAAKQLRLAHTLGAPTFYYFLRIALPANMTLIGAAAMLVFVLSLGFAITPILLGGGGGQTMMIGVLIDEQVNRFGNWSRGAGLSILLTALIAIAAGAAALVLRLVRAGRQA